ncbi:hypothetical protein [Streptomyces decoyicus]
MHHDAKRRSDDRAEAFKACKAHWGTGYSRGGKLECDEYPFAATYQGAAQAKYDPAAPKTTKYSARR